jgi:hypothetical protein
MSCTKYTIINSGDTTISINYMRCEDNMWQYNVEVFPGETRNIWFQGNTFSQVSQNNSLIIEDFGVFPPPPPPTPTPSATTPSGPTPTPTPSVTPSSTPAPALNPSELGALWWVDFTDLDSLNQDGTHIYGAKNKITDTFEFSGSTPVECPLFVPSGYTNESTTYDCGQSYGVPLTNLKGLYSGVTQFTFSIYCNWFDNSQFGGTFLSSLHGVQDYEGNSQNGDWGIFSMPGYPTDNTISMNFIGDLETIAGQVNENDWNQLTIRHRHPGSLAILEGYDNGTLISSAESEIPDYTQIDPIFALLYGGGNIRATEYCFFDRALTDEELQNLNSYFHQKYS